MIFNKHTSYTSDQTALRNTEFVVFNDETLKASPAQKSVFLIVTLLQFLRFTEFDIETLILHCTHILKTGFFLCLP